MTKEETLRFLATHDDPVNWEYPQGFEYIKEISDFKSYLAFLEKNLKVNLEYETQSSIQDASFHSQIFLKGGVLRFSNFGRMVALSIDHGVDSGVVKTIEQLCAELQYVLIDSTLTELPYSGANPGVTGIDNWWIRYFDYV